MLCSDSSLRSAVIATSVAVIVANAPVIATSVAVIVANAPVIARLCSDRLFLLIIVSN